MTEPQPAPDESPTLSHGDLVDRLCDQFEAALRAGEQPRIEDFLTRFPDVGREGLLRELVALEVDLLCELGDTVTFVEYYRRFPAAAAILGSLQTEWDHRHTQASVSDLISTPVDQLSETIDQPQTPRRIKQFELESIIGQGGFGVVWRARDLKLERDVAVKLPRKDRLTTEGKPLFLREARAVAKLRHPNIVAVYEVGEDDSATYIVSELVEGPSLKDWLLRSNLKPWEAARLIAKMAVALHHAHGLGVVHRDLKPANVLIDGRGEPHIADFGLAKRDAGEESLSVSGQLMGTPAYMAPEQACGDHQAINGRTDVYALGTILYELLTGRVPFRGELALLLQQIENVPPEPPRSVNPAVPKDLEAICLKCLSKDQSNRYENAQTLADDLYLFLNGESLRGIPAAVPDRVRKWLHRNRRFVVTLAATFLVALGLTGALVWYFRPAPIPTELRHVEFTTEPPGCEITVVAIDPETGEPDPKKIQNAKGRTPLTMKLAPSDYLVVAVLDDTRFHEVYRHVPSRDEKIPFASAHLHWKLGPSGVLETRAIRIPRPDVTLGMGFVERTGRLVALDARGEGTAEVWSLPSFYVDTREITIDDLKKGGHSESKITGADAEPLALLNYMSCVGTLEARGQRPPSAAELYYLSSIICPEQSCVLPDRSRIEGVHSGIWEWTSTKPGGPFSGTISLPKEIGQASVARMIGCGASDSAARKMAISLENKIQAAGARGVRSTKPRRAPQDFMAPAASTAGRSAGGQ